MTWAVEVGRSCSRRHPGRAGHPPLEAVPGVGEQVPVPAGRVDTRRRSRTRTASREWVHGTQVAVTLAVGSPRSSGVVGGDGGQRAGQRRGVPRAADHRDPLGPGLLRGPQRLAHLRLALQRARVGLRAGRPGPRSSRRRPHRTGQPSRRFSMTSSHQRSGSSYPATSARTAIGSVRTGRRPARRAPHRLSGGSSGSIGQQHGRGQVHEGHRDLMTGRSSVNACHSGENTANGQNADAAGCVVAVGQQGDRGHQVRVGNEARPGRPPPVVPRSAPGRAATPPARRAPPGRNRDRGAGSEHPHRACSRQCGRGAWVIR